MIDVTRIARQVGIKNGTVSMTRGVWKRYVTGKPGGADGSWDKNRCATGVEAHAQATTILRRLLYQRREVQGREVRFGVALVPGRRKRECVTLVATYKNRDIVIGRL